MEFFNDHRKLFGTAFLLFLVLTLFVAIMPALNNQKMNKVLPDAVPLTSEQMKGKHLYIANGCVACHTQQVRNIDMDKVWGSRPGLPADYAANVRLDTWRNTATLMGTERTGPDLTDVGNRQPSLDWNLVHLYNPRIVVKESIMPGYPWMFEYKEEPAENDVVVTVPAEYLNGRKGKIVAKPEALQLVAYLQSLKQVPLPDGTEAPEFLYKKEPKATAGAAAETVIEAEGASLYAANCQTCHMANGEGLAGAFPSLVNSPIVTGDNLELYVDIIMNGYDARPEYAAMTPVGTLMQFTEKEVTAIINYERSSWGHTASKVTEEEVKKILDMLKEKKENP